MCRKIKIICVGFLSIILTIGLLLAINRNETNDSTEIKNIYNFHYSSLSLSLLKSSDQYDYTDDHYFAIDYNETLRETNRGGLYDIWLYVNSIDTNKITKPEQKKIIAYLESLYTSNGFYTSYPNELRETIEVSDLNFLQSTRWALEIYTKLESRPQQMQSINDYIVSVQKQLDKLSIDNFIIYGDYLYLIGTIVDIVNSFNDNPIYDSSSQEILTEKRIRLLDRLYNKEITSLEKYDTAININNLAKKNILKLKSDEIESHINSIQLKSGLFSMNGIGEHVDTQTSYLAIKILHVIGAVVPKKEVMMYNLALIRDESLK